MAQHYAPAAPFSAALMLLVPTVTVTRGVERAAYPALDNGILFYGSFKTYGGTERDVNGLYSVEDTAVIECWYRPDIKANCRVGVLQTGAIYEVIGEPENINLRNQYIRMKVRRVKGGA